MADVKLSPERWTQLCRHLTSLHISARAPDLNDTEEVTLIRPVEIEGVIYLPGVYRAD